MVSTGCRVDADRALQIGLVQELVPAGQALKRALELAGAIAELPQPALIADRQSTVGSSDRPLHAGFEYEAGVGRKIMRDPDVMRRLTDYREQRA